jgi:hypothetical protein
MKDSPGGLSYRPIARAKSAAAKIRWGVTLIGVLDSRL